MISTRTQLRLVALFYAAVTIPVLTWFEIMRTASSSAQSSSITHEMATHAANAFPLGILAVVLYLALAVLAFRFMELRASWRIVTLAGSIVVTLLQIANSVRDSSIVIPAYMHLQPPTYGILAIELSVFWVRALAYALCSFVLWKTFQESKSRIGAAPAALPQ